MNSAIKKLTMLAAGVVLALACGAAPSYAGVAMDDSVRLDPFDPVPQIGFYHSDCDDYCGHHYHHRCYRDCYRRDPCGRECHEAQWAEREAIARYEHQADTYDVLMALYSDQLRWWEWRYRDGGHGVFRPEFDEHGHPIRYEQDGDHHDGDHHDGDWHDGDHHDGDHHDGDWHDADHHDGDHHDGDHHDGDHHDGDWHDGDHHDGDHHDDHDGGHHDGHDGDWHDGDHHDGDRHDGDHHDGEWQDGDGHWHDGPPPDGYPH